MGRPGIGGTGAGAEWRHGVVCWAHQGGAEEGPSATLWAMARAVEAGADGLELDVHLTADGHLVAIHDATVDRTTDGTGFVAELTLADLQRLDAAHWWVPGVGAVHDRPPSAYPLRGRAAGDATLRLPALADVLDRFPDVALSIEVKAPAAALPLVALLRERDRTERLVLSSFSDRVVGRLRRAGQDLPVAPGRLEAAAFVARAWLGIAPAAVRWPALQVPDRLGPLAVATRRVLAAAHRAGAAVDVWTVDDPARMRALVALGVDGIITDRPSVLAGILSQAP